MAAAKALLSAAGLLNPNAKLLKKSAATEHATSSSQPDPAASTDDVSLLPLTELPKSTATEHASASEDGFALGDKDVDKILALLLWMARDSRCRTFIGQHLRLICGHSLLQVLLQSSWLVSRSWVVFRVNIDTTHSMVRMLIRLASSFICTAFRRFQSVSPFACPYAHE